MGGRGPGSESFCNLVYTLVRIHIHKLREYSVHFVHHNLIVIQTPSGFSVHRMKATRRLHQLGAVPAQLVLGAAGHEAQQLCSDSVLSHTLSVVVALGRVRGQVDPTAKPRKSWNIASNPRLVKAPLADATHTTVRITAAFVGS